MAIPKKIDLSKCPFCGVCRIVLTSGKVTETYVCGSVAPLNDRVLQSDACRRAQLVQKVSALHAELEELRSGALRPELLSPKDWDLLVFALYHASGHICETRPDTVDADTADELGRLANFFDTLVSEERSGKRGACEKDRLV